jgi:uncharacterized membrane protein
MSQNRQSSVDRNRAELNYRVNLKAEVEIAELHRKIDALDRLLRIRGGDAPSKSPLTGS